jgi:hypothetical protein
VQGSSREACESPLIMTRALASTPGKPHGLNWWLLITPQSSACFPRVGVIGSSVEYGGWLAMPSCPIRC